MTEAEAMFGNPGSLHAEGVQARALLEGAREGVAHELACKARQVIFTSGLTESINLAILGFARKLAIRGTDLSKTHWITTSIEHASVLDSFGEVERLGGNVTFVEPDARGLILPEALQRTMRENTVFISIGWGNNEIGTVQKMSDLSRVIHGHRESIIFHTDAGQAPLYRTPHVHTLGVDMLSLGAGKLYGPRSSGVLFVREPEGLAPIILGGGQENGLRSGTENVIPAIGCAKALELIARERAPEAKRLEKMRDTFAQEIEKKIGGILINGSLKHSLPHMLNISIPGERSGEYLALALDHAGIALSTKSACNEGEAASHVVAALGGESWRAVNTLRFSFGRDTTAREIARAAEILGKSFRLDCSAGVIGCPYGH